jgi:hypothetical protein
VLYWKDNSNNEDGFDLDFELCGQSFHFRVPANTTTFAIPSEVQSQISCTCGCHSIDVTAFNAAGRATGTWAGACGDCAPLATATPAPVILMPSTGGGSGGPWTWWQLALFAGGSAAVAGGALALARLRRVWR